MSGGAVYTHENLRELGRSLDQKNSNSLGESLLCHAHDWQMEVARTKQEKNMLECAGRMADIAGCIVGESLYARNRQPCGLFELSELLMNLKTAVREYNEATLVAVKNIKII